MTQNTDIIADLDKRAKFKQSLVAITSYMREIDDFREGMKEAIADMQTEYSVDKKTIRKLASTMYKHNYSSLQEENRHFSALYELLVEGKLRDDDEPKDVLDRE